MNSATAKARINSMLMIGMMFFASAASASSDVPSALVERIEIGYQLRDAAAIEDARRQLLAVNSGRSAYFAAYASFRQALLTEETPARAASLVEQCIEELNRFVVAQPEDAEARALLGSCYGISTRYNRLGMASRGLAARSHLAAARKLAPANPWVVLQDGMADFATPRIFGGDREQAISKLERATTLFENAADDGSRMAAWGTAEAWQQLAIVYRATGRTAEATAALATASTLLAAIGPVSQQMAAL